MQLFISGFLAYKKQDGDKQVLWWRLDRFSPILMHQFLRIKKCLQQIHFISLPKVEKWYEYINTVQFVSFFPQVFVAGMDRGFGLVAQV